MKQKKSLNEVVDEQIYNVMKQVDKSQQLQSFIHPDVYFKRNSINLLVGRRGSGKTFNVLREIIKIDKLYDNAGYTNFFIVTNQPNDATVNEMVNIIKNIKVNFVSYDEIINVLNELINGKTAYDQVIRSGIENEITNESRENILNIIQQDKFTNEIPHTAILLDDAINILKDKKYKQLEDLLFRNRQPRITFFICAQDPMGIPVKVRRNIDSFWLFGGFKDKSLFNKIINQFYPEGTLDKLQIWNKYILMDNNDILIFNYETNGTNILIIEN
jgi:hypothetical protein